MRRRTHASDPVGIDVTFEESTDDDLPVQASACIRRGRSAARSGRDARCGVGVGKTPSAAFKDALLSLVNEHFALAGRPRRRRSRR